MRLRPFLAALMCFCSMFMGIRPCVAQAIPPTSMSTLGKAFQRNSLKTVVVSRRGYTSLGNGNGADTRATYFSNARTGASAAVGGCYQEMEVAQTDACNVRLVFDNHYGGYSSGASLTSDNVCPNNFTIHVAIVLRDNTAARVVFPVTFSGGTVAQPTLTGGVYSYAVSDPVDGLVLAKGQRYWVNTWVTATNAAIMWPLYTSAVSWSSYADAVNTGTSGSVGGTDQSQTGSVSGANQCDAQYGMYGPSLILGDAPLDRAQACVGLIGDSRIGGDVDSSYPLDDTSYIGNDLIVNSTPYFNINQSGEALAHLFTNGLPNAYLKYRLKLLGLARPEWVIVAYGVNDATGANGITAQTCAQMQANMTLLCQTLHRMGFKIEVHTVSPALSNVTSTDQYVTQSFQTVNSSAWTNIKAFNDWLMGRANGAISGSYPLSGIYMNRVVDVEGWTGDPARNGYWAVESTPRTDYTGQGASLAYTATTITVTGANFAVNSLKGMVWQAVGTGAGYYKIASNTATVITLGTSFSATPTSGTDVGKLWWCWTIDGIHFNQAAKIRLGTLMDAKYPNRFGLPSIPIQ